MELTVTPLLRSARQVHSSSLITSIMYNTVAESDADEDLGSGGALLLPDLKDSTGHIRHLAVGASKDQNIYVVNRDNTGKFNSTKNNIWEEIGHALPAGEAVNQILTRLVPRRSTRSSRGELAR